MPKSARAITNDLGVNQGFLMSANDKTLVFMPLEATQLKSMFITSALPYLIERCNKLNKVSVLKTFGLSGGELMSLLKDIRKNKQKVEIICSEKHLDGEVIINYPERLDKIVIDGYVSAVFKRLSAYIYADSDTTLQEKLFSLLHLSNSTLSVAEDATNGLFISTFYKHNQDAKLALKEAYFVPTDESKVKILGVERDILRKTQIDGSDIAYQMAVGTLENAGSDYIAATYAIGNMLYLALGNTEGIHVLKQKYETEELEPVFTNSAYFNLIRKIKKKDFHLPQTTI
jgi:nicotinamide-nucleotide amidase